MTRTTENGLGDRIREARNDAGMTLRELGDAIGVDPRTVAGYQAGRSRPSYERLQMIARATGKAMSYFVNEWQPV